MVWNEPGKNNKDPWDSGGNSPDLERLVKNLQRRLGMLFGGKRPGRKGMHPVSVLWILPLLIIAWLASGFYTVGAGDRSIVLVFGRAGPVVPPGLHWHLPWPVGVQLTVNGVDQGRDYTHLYNQLVTRDGSIVSVTVQVHYQISNLHDYLFKVAAPGADETGSKTLFDGLVDNAVRTAVAHGNLADMLDNGSDQAEAEAHDLLQSALRENDTGIAVTRLAFQRVDVPQEVESAYADVRKAKQDAQQAQDNARVYANRVVAEAQGSSDADVTEANAYKITRRSEAQADVARFNEILNAYRAEPALTRDQLYLQTMQDVLGKVNKVVVDAKSGNVTVQFSPAASGDSIGNDTGGDKAAQRSAKPSAAGNGKSGGRS
ncbi:MAG TPA: FtsH protease activity modulator HflK [Gammaproteobacteria bacterium]|nr:FtsH protease activity modulator HflK [Gammaproteobacteria bacterium]